MEQFVTFQDALNRLDISADRLNELRESGALRAYRDGSSWKFRGDEIEKMASDGVPDLPPPSDIGLVDPADLVDAEPLEVTLDDDDLRLADLAEIEGEDKPVSPEPDESALDLRMVDTDAISAGSELELEGLEDTVTAGASDLSLDTPEEPTDSILLSEEELGESVTGSPSTIIGRKELGLPDADLELELELEDVTDEEDTKLSYSEGASDVLSSKVSGSGVLDEMEDLTSAKKAFKDLEEVELDLAAESSLALKPADVADARAKAAQSLSGPSPESDLRLGEDVEVGDEANMGSTDVPLEELGVGQVDVDQSGSDAELELAGDSDLILADAGGSDITLDSGDSGINLIAPSDSGLALDEIPLDVGGSAILSSLSLEGSDPEISLLGSDVGAAASGAGLQTDDDFQLTPLSEGGMDDGDSSSQVIALDADLGGFEGGGVLLEEGFTDDGDDGVVLTEDFSGAAVGDLGVGAYPGAMVGPVAIEGQYSTMSVVALTCCMLLLGLGGLMTLDMLSNIWAWQGESSISSGVIDALLGLWGGNQ